MSGSFFLCNFGVMKWKTFIRRAYLLLAIVLLFVDLKFNVYFFYLISIVFFVMSVMDVLNVFSQEKQSVAGFQVKSDLKGQTKEAAKALFSVLVIIGILYYFSDLLPDFKILDSVGKVYYVPLIALHFPSLIFTFRFYQFFILKEGVFQVSDHHLFSWDEIESYSIQFTDYEFSLSLKFKNDDFLDFEPRKKKDIDIQSLIALLEKQGLLNREQLSFETG